MATVAVFIALGGGAYAASQLPQGSVGRAQLKDGAVTTKKLHARAVTGATLAANAVTSGKVADFSLRLHDLGGKANHGTYAVASNTTVPAGSCTRFFLTLFPPASGVIGSLVVGYLTDGQGHAVLDNFGTVVPTTISETTQGGAIANLVVCATSIQTIPAGSVFHYRLIGR